MSSNMLTYAKTLLIKVSFDPYLFKRELQKSTLYLMPHEYLALKQWIKNELSLQVQDPKALIYFLD
jgi:hypothetical protein